MADDPTPDRADRDADRAAQEEAYWAEIRSEEEYRYSDGPFCGCTHDKLRFLEVAGILDDDGLTRYGQRASLLLVEHRPHQGAAPAVSRPPPPR